MKGQILAENGLVDEAIKAYKQSLKILPNAPLIVLPLANLLLEKDTGIENTKKIKKMLNKVLLIETDNVLAWRLKGITHNRLNESIKADLAAAEENLLRSQYNRARFFSEKVIENSLNNSPERIRAYDILRIVKNN